jgi:Tol biopolymer transport system component
LFQARRSEAISETQAESYQRSGFLLWIRSFEAIDPRPLLGTESDSTITAFWSPDGRHIGFFADGKLRRYNLMDGTVQQICDNPGGFDFGADWNEAGQIIFATVPGGRIYVVPASGGDPKPIAELDTPPMGLGYHMPQFLPDGNRFLFSVESSEEEQSGLYLGSLDTPQEVRQIVSGRGGWALSAGHLLFVRDGSLFAQPFDAERAEVGGEPVVIAAPVITWTGNLDIGWFGTSRSETIAYLHGSGTPNRVQLAWVDRSGSLVGTVGEPGDYGQLTLAPDGRKVALEIRDEEGQYDLWIMDLARGVSSRLTATPEDERDPVWSPDSGAVAFMAKPRSSLGIGELRLKSLRAGGSETVLTDSADADIPESWSAQGATLFVVRQTQENEQSVWSISLQEDGEAERVLSTGFLVDEPHLSPDGGWLAYVSAESGRDEVYAEPYGRDGERVRVSVEGGGQPRWREDGQELFYVTLDGRLMSVNIEGSDQQLAVSLPQQLFEIANLQGTGYDDYAVSADGQRFLVKLPTEEEEGPEFHVVTNWTSLLQ